MKGSLVNMSSSTSAVAMEGPTSRRDVYPSKIRIPLRFELKQARIQKLGAEENRSPTGPINIAEDKIGIAPIGSKVADEVVPKKGVKAGGGDSRNNYIRTISSSRLGFW